MVIFLKGLGMGYSITTTTVERDEKGRITKVESMDHFDSHSVCNGCGKDMPSIWDTVCHRCNRTFCYNCSNSIGDYWVCNECKKQ
jgi:hypothetical protein